MTVEISYIPLPKRIPSGKVFISEREVAYRITDPLFGEFKIYKTYGHRRGFWENEPAKVDRLIAAFKMGHNVKNACIYAGITEDAWGRFLEAYPSFRGLKEACQAVTSLAAMDTIQTGVRTDPVLAFRYLNKRGDFNFPTGEWLRQLKLEEERKTKKLRNL